MKEDQCSTGRFSQGDCVSVTRAIGVLGTRVPAETCGVVVAVAPTGEVEVHFVNGRVELVDVDRLRSLQRA